MLEKKRKKKEKYVTYETLVFTVSLAECGKDIRSGQILSDAQIQ